MRRALSTRRFGSSPSGEHGLACCCVFTEAKSVVKSKSFSGMQCSIAGALEAIGDRWSFLIIRDLSLGLTRYDELRAKLNIPPATLADRLKHLTQSGIIERISYQERPLRHRYELTAKGRDLWMVSVALREWGDRWKAAGLGTPPVEMRDVESGRRLTLALVDAESGALTSLQRARMHRLTPDDSPTSNLEGGEGQAAVLAEGKGEGGVHG